MQEDTTNLSFLEHLEQLRHVLLKMLVAFFVCCIPCWFLSPKALELLLAYAAPTDFPLHYFTLMEPFVTRLKITGFLALVLSLPLIAHALWNFLKPGLFPSERSTVIRASFAICFLALFGASVAFLFIVPALIRFSLAFSGPSMQPVIGIGDFTGLVLVVLLAAMGLFQFPVLLHILLRLGFINLSLIRKKRPHIIVLIFFLSALFSPPDVLSQLLLAVPAWLLFEVSLIYFSRHFQEKDTSYEEIYAEANQQQENTLSQKH